MEFRTIHQGPGAGEHPDIIDIFTEHTCIWGLRQYDVIPKKKSHLVQSKGYISPFRVVPHKNGDKKVDGLLLPKSVYEKAGYYPIDDQLEGINFKNFLLSYTVEKGKIDCFILSSFKGTYDEETGRIEEYTFLLPTHPKSFLQWSDNNVDWDKQDVLITGKLHVYCKIIKLRFTMGNGFYFSIDREWLSRKESDNEITNEIAHEPPHPAYSLYYTESGEFIYVRDVFHKPYKFKRVGGDTVSVFPTAPIENSNIIVSTKSFTADSHKASNIKEIYDDPSHMIRYLCKNKF